MSLATKLQLKPGQGIAVVNAPAGFELDAPAGVDALLIFVSDSDELEELGEPLFQAARDDRLAWLVYPKGGQLGTDLNRDVLRRLTEGHAVRPVSQVSIDDVWSALRLRPA